MSLNSKISLFLDQFNEKKFFSFLSTRFWLSDFKYHLNYIAAPFQVSVSTEDESTERLQESHDGEEYFEILLFLYDMAMAVVHKNVQ